METTRIHIDAPYRTFREERRPRIEVVRVKEHAIYIETHSILKSPFSFARLLWFGSCRRCLRFSNINRGRKGLDRLRAEHFPIFVGANKKKKLRSSFRRSTQKRDTRTPIDSSDPCLTIVRWSVGTRYGDVSFIRFELVLFLRYN